MFDMLLVLIRHLHQFHSTIPINMQVYGGSTYPARHSSNDVTQLDLVQYVMQVFGPKP